MNQQFPKRNKKNQQNNTYIMKRQLNFWMLLLPLALGIASCSENIDNPVPPTSAVDEGEWNVDI